MSWILQAVHRLRGAARRPPAGAACRPMRFVIYTRPGCHLCEAARGLLDRSRERYPLIIEEVDVTGNPELEREHGRTIPVVEVDGKVRFRGSINEVLLRRLLDHARRSIGLP